MWRLNSCPDKANQMSYIQRGGVADTDKLEVGKCDFVPD